jgi:hypothetical protein
MPGRDDESQAAAGPCRPQLCAVLGSSCIKLSEYICTRMNEVLNFIFSAYRIKIAVIALFIDKL